MAVFYNNKYLDLKNGKLYEIKTLCKNKMFRTKPMDITVYKRGKDGKKVCDELKTKAINVKFKERCVDIEKNLYIGRNDTNAIVISDDPLVSRKHALIEHSKGIYYLSDLGSTNGTYLNNQPIGKNKVELKSGDVIRIGKTELSIV